MSDNTFLTVKVWIVGVCSAFTAAFGWAGWLALAFVMCMGVDYATGSAAALRTGKWSSHAARDGLWHKAGMIAGVLVAAILDAVLYIATEIIPGLDLPFEFKVLFLPLVLCWYIMTELGSIVENAAALGAPIPPFLRKALECLTAKLNQTGGTDDE